MGAGETCVGTVVGPFLILLLNISRLAQKSQSVLFVVFSCIFYVVFKWVGVYGARMEERSGRDARQNFACAHAWKNFGAISLFYCKLIFP